MAKEIISELKHYPDRIKIYQFWASRNKSDLYSKKLEKLFNKAAKLLSEFPDIETPTDFHRIRVKIIRDYKMFYLNEKDCIQIIRVWDTRQDPATIDCSKV